MSVVPLGWCFFSCHLKCGVNRNAVATCQQDGACPDGKSCLLAAQAPFKRTTQYSANPKCSAWSDIRRPSAGSLRRSEANFCLVTSSHGGCFGGELQ